MMQMRDCPRLPKDDPSGRVYDYAKISWPVERELYRPIESETRGKIEKIQIREPLYGDMRMIAREPDKHEASVKGVAALCGLSPGEIEKMTARDWTETSEFLTDFLS